MKQIYFDNAATTKPCEAAVAAAVNVMEDTFGNPSSMHAVGFAAEKVILRAAKTISPAVGASENDVIFTSGGTEANNTAIFSATLANKYRAKKIITTRAEHPSILEAVKSLEKEGFETAYLRLTKSGKIDADELHNLVDDNTALVTIAHVNSETGVIAPISELIRAVKAKNARTLFHVDAVQSFRKLKLDFSADYMSLSGHKIHGIKGCGALIAGKGVPLRPHIVGGGQQQNRRSGTENTVSIAAFAAAVGDYRTLNDVSAIKSYIAEKIAEKGAVINSPLDETGSPYILNFSMPRVRSEVALHAFEAEGVYISAGAACSSRKKVSGVLQAYGLPEELAKTALRLSFCPQNTMEEAKAFIAVFNEIMPYLIKYGE
ncbi:cysteine desulfurase [Clostridia bacterium]|nr:cysteine desulfurase [Clostridia bacterium]